MNEYERKAECFYVSKELLFHVLKLVFCVINKHLEFRCIQSIVQRMMQQNE